MPGDNHDKTGLATLTQQLKELRREYAVSLPERFQAIGAAWQALDLEAGHDTLRALHHEVHRLAGSAGSFGYAELGAGAHELEQLLKLPLLEQRPPTTEERQSAARLISRLQALSRGPAQGSPMHHAAPTASGPWPNQTVYLVDDDPDLAREITLQLNLYNYRVESFTSCSQLEQALTDEIPAAVIMDMILPEGELAGAEALQRIRRNRNMEFPVLFISVRTDFNSRLAAVRAGANAYLTKPLDIGQLLEQIDQITGRHADRPYRILIIDDDASLAEHYALVLHEAGMDTLVVNRPEQCLAVINDYEPELILMDVYMPECTGIELAQVIRQQPRFTSIPIVFLSTERDPGIHTIAMASGGDDFLIKPLLDNQLVTSVSLRAARARHLNQLMIQDGLTGLLRQNKVKEMLPGEIDRSRRLGTTLTIAMLDIDHFKKVNDRYGHLTGDRVLKQLAQTLRQRLRASDTLGRYGGEEFIILFHECGAGTASEILEAIRSEFADTVHHSGTQPFQVTFSAGLAELREGADADHLLHEADMALYRAKSGGRNRIIVAPG